MTLSQKQELIAIDQGWILKEKLFHNGSWKHVPTWVEAKYYEGKEPTYTMAGQVIGATPPRYFSDLNVIQEVVLKIPGWGLFGTEWMKSPALEYHEILVRVCLRLMGKVEGPPSMATVGSATERAEAYGLWKKLWT